MLWPPRSSARFPRLNLCLRQAAGCNHGDPLNFSGRARPPVAPRSPQAPRVGVSGAARVLSRSPQSRAQPGRTGCMSLRQVRRASATFAHAPFTVRCPDFRCARCRSHTAVVWVAPGSLALLVGGNMRPCVFDRSQPVRVHADRGLRDAGYDPRGGLLPPRRPPYTLQSVSAAPQPRRGPVIGTEALGQERARATAAGLANGSPGGGCSISFLH